MPEIHKSHLNNTSNKITGVTSDSTEYNVKT